MTNIENLLNCYRLSGPFGEAFRGIIHGLFDNSAKRINLTIGKTVKEKNDNFSKKDGGWKCLHSNIGEFLYVLSSVIKENKWSDENLRKLRFLDVGCGVGQKVYLAQMIGFYSFGLELREQLIEEAERLFNEIFSSTYRYICDAKSNLPPLLRQDLHDAFIQWNALTYPHYDQFDVIYFYWPIKNTDLQKKLEEQIARTAKVGAIVVPFSPHGIFSGHRGGYPQSLAYLTESIKLGWEKHNRYYIRKSLGE